MAVDEKEKLAHESLYRELHKIDDLVEKHAQLVLAITAALFVFATAHLDSPIIISFAATFGIVAVGEWVLKIIRHRRLFRSAHEKLTEVEKTIGIATLRPLATPYRNLFSFDGFTILLWLSILFTVFWISLAVSARLGLLEVKQQSHSPNFTEISDQVEANLLKLGGVPASTWQLEQIQYQPQMRSYEFVYRAKAGHDTVRIVFDITLGKIVAFQRKTKG